MTQTGNHQIIQNAINAIGQIADQAWQEGYTGLQDVCLILSDTLGALPENTPLSSDLSALIVAWPTTVATYKQNIKEGTPGILGLLRHPELNIALSDEEFEMIEQQLNKGNGTNDTSNVAADAADKTHLTIEDCSAMIGQLADQMAEEGNFGLQDTCLLVVETVTELAQSEDSAALAEIVTILAGLPTLIEAYKHNPKQAAAGILSLLQQPALKIPLSEEEFAMLEATLTEGVVDDAPLADDVSAAKTDITADATQGPAGLLTPAAQEILAMMQAQAEIISRCLKTIKSPDAPNATDQLQQAGDMLRYFGLASETAGYVGLSKVSTHTAANIGLILEQSANFTDERLGLLQNWLEEVTAYLQDVTDTGPGQQLVFQLCDENWPLPINLEDAAEILQQIRAVGSDAPVYEEESRKQNAEVEDVSLALPDDVNQELLDILLQELPVQTQEFSQAIQRIQAGGNLEDLKLAQRIAHTLKGSANTVGIKGIAVLTHNLEDILTACSNEGQIPGYTLSSSLIKAADCLEGMSDALLGQGEPPDDAQSVLQEVLDWANYIDIEGLPKTDEALIASRTVSAADTQEKREKTEQEQPQVAMVRVPSDQIESLFRLSGESIILNGQAQESLRRMKAQLGMMQAQFALLQQLGSELERLIDLKDLSGRAFGISDIGFDMLEMDQYNELHTVSRRMAESAIDAREISLDVSKELDGMNETLGFQQGLVIDSQGIIMQTRLVPISTIVPRLQRSLRQTCRLIGKDCDLSVSGERIMVDSDTLNAMLDPLMHILRNAVDHGIESQEERKAAGKPEKGLIKFEFDREGNNILVHCRDDGKGLDYGAIRAAAEKRGALQPNQDVSEDELKRFILRPNFSTRTVTTQTSGRGVGMDVVRSQIIEMGGTLTLNSYQGLGLNVELRVPLPLSLTYALITNVGRYRVAIANKGLSQIIYSAQGDIIEVDGKETLVLDGASYPTERLDELLGAASYPVERLNDMLHVTDKRKQSRTYGAVLLVQNEDKTTAVLIGPITNSLDVVIKGMGQYIGKIPGYIGATILGDGTVTPVLDIPELLRMPARAMEDMFSEPQEIASPMSKLPSVLVVDDSLSQRRTLEQLLADAGFRVRTARDGIEAVEILAQFSPNIILTDLEMPRMNGIELALHVRSNERIKSVPVIMITSRTTQKHRKIAEEAGIDSYMTKPVRDEELVFTMNELMERRTSGTGSGSTESKAVG